MKKIVTVAAVFGLISASGAWADGIVLTKVKDDAELLKGVNRCQAMVDTLNKAEPPRNLGGYFHMQTVMDYVAKDSTSYQQGQEITQKVLEAANPIAMEQMVAVCLQRTGAVLHELAMNKAHELSDNASELVKDF
ncbi:MAG: hypothetical protein V7739_02425 [Motiliproteus sp.]